MKVLIISLPRTGSTSLLNKISNDRNLKPFFEPFDGTNRHTYDEKRNDVVVKTIICTQYPKNVVNYMDWIIDFSGLFDEVILLSRKDLTACAESHAYSVYNRNRGFTSNDEYLWEKTPIDDLCYQNVTKWNESMIELSSKLNIPITYYEDIYDLNDKGKLRKGNRDGIRKKII
jgi:hypothetical protein